VDSDDRVIRDEHGSQVLFHGVNVAFMDKPFLPDTKTFDPLTSLTSGDIKNLKQLGINFVRLGVPWEAVEIEPGVYDELYLNKIDGIITELAKSQIYTMITFHQVLLTKKLCGYGIPSFYANKFIME
jgi:endoglycosylceramidase